MAVKDSPDGIANFWLSLAVLRIVYYLFFFFLFFFVLFSLVLFCFFLFFAEGNHKSVERLSRRSVTTEPQGPVTFKSVREEINKICYNNGTVCLRGPKGEPGPPGEKGATGDVGPRGFKGNQGYPGSDGMKGETGIKGEPGIPGRCNRRCGKGLPRCSQCPSGAKGEKGEPGVDGRKGTRGDFGSDGVTGIGNCGSVNQLMNFSLIVPTIGPPYSSPWSEVHIPDVSISLIWPWLIFLWYYQN